MSEGLETHPHSKKLRGPVAHHQLAHTASSASSISSFASNSPSSSAAAAAAPSYSPLLVSSIHSIAPRPFAPYSLSDMSQKSQFLEKLYKMTNNEAHFDCIKWSDDVSFWVSDIAQFSRDILPLYFNHNNYASFVRQLNMYGFHRKTDSKDKVVPGVGMIERFQHPYFQRGRKDLLANIHRKSSARQKKVKSEPGYSDGESETQSEAGGGSSSYPIHEGRIAQLEQQVQYLHIQNQALAAQCARQQDMMSRITRLLASCGIMDESHLHADPHWSQQQQQAQQHPHGQHHFMQGQHPGHDGSQGEEPALQVIVEDDEIQHNMDIDLDHILSSFPTNPNVNMTSVENAMVDNHLDQYS